MEQNNKDIKNIEIKIKKMKEELDRYNYYYYSKNESLVSDIEYDKLLKELEDLEKNIQNLRLKVLQVRM